MRLEPADDLEAIFDTEFFVNIGNVILNRMLRDKESVYDVFSGFSLKKECHDLLLSRSKFELLKHLFRIHGFK